MKYKTLFRVIMKALGVWLFTQGATSLVGDVTYHIAAYFAEEGDVPYDLYSLGSPWLVQTYAATAFQLICGLYLFFGGKWIANMAIPGNREYCHECGYTLTANRSGRCPECGTDTGQSSREANGAFVRPTVAAPEQPFENDSMF